MTLEQGGGLGDALSFDLTSRPWLPVLWSDGGEAELPLVEVFARAGRIRRLAGDLPTQDFALTRLLLAILHDALDGPADADVWADLWESEEPFAAVPAYLAQHRERFDLLHPRTPFFQTPGLRTSSGEVFSLNRIVADVPNGSPFFTTRFPGASRIGFAEAARWVVHAQAYDTSGIKTGVVGDPRAKGGRAYPQGVGWCGNLGGVLVEGANLRETLLLNLVAADHPSATADGDLPTWRREPTSPGAADDLGVRPAGLRDLYTWQSRRLLLHADADGVHGVVLTYGDPLPVQNAHTFEPMSAWRRSEPQEKKLGTKPVYMPREHNPARAAWRGLEALISRNSQSAAGGEPAPSLRPGIVDWLSRLTFEGFLPRRSLLRLRTYGAAYGTQQSVVDEVTSDTVAMAVALLHEADRELGQAAVDAVADADTAVRAVGDLAADLAKAAGREPGEVKEAAWDAGYGALDGPYRLWLAAIREGDDPRQTRAAWQRTAHRVLGQLGDELVAAAGEAAWQGRVVSYGKGEAWLNAASADLWFRSRLGRALPLAATGPDQAPDDDSQEAPA